jgi:hypothetical protein
MDDSEIQQLVNELDAAVTKDDSKLLIYVDPDHGNCVFVGNRKGYLRVGIEMLRAAVVPLAANESITPIDIKYLCGERGLRVDTLERREDITPRVFLRAGRVCYSAQALAWAVWRC